MVEPGFARRADATSAGSLPTGVAPSDCQLTNWQLDQAYFSSRIGRRRLPPGRPRHHNRDTTTGDAPFSYAAAARQARNPVATMVTKTAILGALAAGETTVPNAGGVR